MTLRALIYHATGDEAVESIKTTRVPGIFMDAPWVDDPAALDLLKEKAFTLLRRYRDGTLQPGYSRCGSRAEGHESGRGRTGSRGRV